jgi:hypothetical protein
MTPGIAPVYVVADPGFSLLLAETPSIERLPYERRPTCSERGTRSKASLFA